MDISKLRFDIEITYDCDDGAGDAILDNGTYEQAKHVIEEFGGGAYINGYYHYVSIDRFDVHDENSELLDFSTILDGDYEWVPEYYSSDKDEAGDIPGKLLDLLEDLKNGGDGKKDREVKELKTRIEKLKNELKEAEEKLAKLEEKK